MGDIRRELDAQLECVQARRSQDDFSLPSCMGECNHVEARRGETLPFVNCERVVIFLINK